MASEAPERNVAIRQKGDGMRLGQAIGVLLTEYGVNTVFGIPGVHTLELFRDIDESGIRTIVPRHEQGAGFMADAYTRVSGKPGVCYLITGPGVLNAATPIAQAWHDSVPMLVVASTVTRAQLGARRGTLHDTPDLAEVMRPFTLISETATTVERVVEVIDEAFRRFETERPRPVYLGIPRDLLEEEVGVLRRPAPPAASAPTLSDTPAAAGDMPPNGDSLTAALTRLAAAERPLIIAGGGARHDAQAVAALAERLDAPVVLTGNAKGLLPLSHPLNADVSLPFEATQQLVEDSDLVLALGTELSDFEYLYSGSLEPTIRALIRVDIDPTVRHPQHPSPPLVMRVASFAERALAHLPGLASRTSGSTGRERAELARAGLASARAADAYTPWIDAIAAALPEDAIIAADSAQIAYQSHHFLGLDTPGRWLAPYGFGTLGPALPMAVGAAVAAPDRPVIALAGDGGSLFTLTELATARELGQPIVLVLWDNSGYREIEISFDRVGINPTAVATSAHDLGLIAAGFGAEVHRPESPAELTSALAAATRRPVLSVIHIRAPRELCVEPFTPNATGDSK